MSAEGNQHPNLGISAPPQLYGKYDVRRRDDRDGKHSSCWLFVLDPQCDREAWFALSRYAELLIQRGVNVQLGRELYAKLEEVNQAHEYRTNGED